ncbi:MAG: 1-deoxy-D-xylulose-5-phosphate synthase [Candidatus Omnitrophica bacterium]|nr:1-deoxy-D-xylulose-5-phosphate synthase [Candidatus Omnitrophota bacterium]
MSQWLDQINSPEDLKRVPKENLPEVAREYRERLIETVAQTGGHLGASLGALELNIALHYVFDSPRDKICWDVGHQAYVHKMITGRKDRMTTLRKMNGLSGFPSPFENPHDHFIVAHAGTAISQALGLAVARDQRGGSEKVVAVVGDGSLTAGLAYEALNNAGHLQPQMLVVLNDNEWSISKNVGALSKYLNKVITNPLYNRIRAEVENQLDRFPRLRRIATSGLESMKHLLVPGIIFEELGFRYFGPLDGHDILGLVGTLKKLKNLKELCLLHIVTQKGKGIEWAEQDAERVHGVTPFDLKTGAKLKSPEEEERAKREGISYTKAFVQSLLQLARKDKKIVAITAAMPSGTGLNEFQKEFPDRFFDVGIAEQHAITFAGGLAKGGLKPVCAIYSTFLQRSQDQLIHDVALQRLPLVVAMDRAGLVGADGATHNGVFDISYLGHIPGVALGAPRDEAEMLQMLEIGLNYPGLFALRFPRGNISNFYEQFPVREFELGEGEVLREGREAVLLTLGSMVETACRAADLLAHEGVECRVINLRFARPLDEKLILETAQKTHFFFTLEEHNLTGGLGSKVLEFFERHGLAGEIQIHRFALPDQFIEHGPREILLDRFGLSPEKVAAEMLRGLRPAEVKFDAVSEPRLLPKL